MKRYSKLLIVFYILVALMIVLSMFPCSRSTSFIIKQPCITEAFFIIFNIPGIAILTLVNVIFNIQIGGTFQDRLLALFISTIIYIVILRLFRKKIR